jgi:hypothetical protein
MLPFFLPYNLFRSSVFLVYLWTFILFSPPIIVPCSCFLAVAVRNTRLLPCVLLSRSVCSPLLTLSSCVSCGSPLCSPRYSYHPSLQPLLLHFPVLYAGDFRFGSHLRDRLSRQRSSTPAARKYSNITWNQTTSASPTVCSATAIAPSDGPNWVVFTWTLEQNRVSETLCLK